MQEIRVLIHTALFFEAEIFIRKYNLKRDLDITDFMFFYNKESKIGLITSTKSLASVAFSIGYIKAKFDFIEDLKTINFGIAGAKDLAIGTIKEIVKVTDNSSFRSYFPSYNNAPYFATDTLTTFIKPNEDYSIEGLYDMEASVFFEAISKLTERENIRIIKLVSDNKNNPIKDFDHKKINQVISSKADELFDFLDKLLSSQQQDKTMLFDFNRCTFQENKILNTLIRQIKAFDPDFDFCNDNYSDYNEMRSALEAIIDKQEHKY